MAKVSKLVLSYPHDMREPDNLRSVIRGYKVVRAQHTTEFNPGDFLSKTQVDELNASRNWDVTSVANPNAQ